MPSVGLPLWPEACHPCRWACHQFPPCPPSACHQSPPCPPWPEADQPCHRPRSCHPSPSACHQPPPCTASAWWPSGFHQSAPCPPWLEARDTDGMLLRRAGGRGRGREREGEEARLAFFEPMRRRIGGDGGGEGEVLVGRRLALAAGPLGVDGALWRVLVIRVLGTGFGAVRRLLLGWRPPIRLVNPSPPRSRRSLARGRIRRRGENARRGNLFPGQGQHAYQEKG